MFGTVVDWRGSVAHELAPFLGRHGLGGFDPASVADAWRGLYQPSMEPIRRGEREWVRLSVLHRETLEIVLRRYDLDPARIPEAELADLARAWERLDPWPDSAPKFGRLPWDMVAGAELTRSYKPQPQTYLGPADVLGLQPHETALVAAHNDDLLAARACGLKTVFICRPTEHGPAQITDLEAEHDWDIVAPDMLALAQRLGC